jgi:hypothetical protein
VFDLHGNQRLTEWKRVRDNLETSDTAFDDVAALWSRAPFVFRYLNPDDPSGWPDPWKLILDGKFDELAICLGMLYTIRLTDRFKFTKTEIFEVLDTNEKRFILVVNDEKVLNWEYRLVVDFTALPEVRTRVVFSNPDKI